MTDAEMARAVADAAAGVRPAKLLQARFVDLPGARVHVDDLGGALVDAAAAGGFVALASRSFEVGDLFHGTGPREWSVYELCSGAWRDAWDRHRDRVPDALPRRLRTTPVARAEIGAFPGYELRCVRAEPLDGGAPAPFRAGRPLHERAG